MTASFFQVTLLGGLGDLHLGDQKVAWKKLGVYMLILVRN